MSPHERFLSLFLSQTMDDLNKTTMPSTIKLSDACSVGEDLNINRFFVGREHEIKRALEAIQEKRVVLVDGSVMTGKSYFVLKCFEQLGINIQAPTRLAFDESAQAGQMGVYCSLKEDYSKNPLFENVIVSILQGSGDYHGLISLLPSASLRREFIQETMSFYVSENDIPIPPKSRLEAALRLFEDVVDQLKNVQSDGFCLVICLDELKAREMDTYFLQFIERALQIGVQFIITRHTNRHRENWIEFENKFPHSEVISIGRMPFSEVNALIDQIEMNIASSFTFNIRSREMIFELSGGLPYFVHYLCGGALEMVNDSDYTTIDERVISVLREIIEKGVLPSVFDSLFQTCSRSEEQKQQMRNYASLPLSDLAYNESLSLSSTESPIGFLLHEGDDFRLIASPPFQVFAKLRLGI